MRKFELFRDGTGAPALRVPFTGQALLREPLMNKGTGFPADERAAFGLEGLLPSQHISLRMQARRIYAAISEYSEPLERYVELAALQDRNEHLFYRVLCDHLEELMPIVYTPTVGLATRRFSAVFRRGRGVWITPDFAGRVADVLRAAAPWEGVQLLVVTDNESILGIGDQGAGGMAISVGKLALYCAGAGIHPARTLPVSLDVGTDNPELLADDQYVGWRQPRLRGDAYVRLVDEFVDAVRTVFPGALIQWEDFRKDNALRILDRHRDRVLSFNDDIQGTSAVALAGVLCALRATGGRLVDQRMLIYGAGAAGLGIHRQLRDALRSAGADAHAQTRAVAALDSTGLLVDDKPQREVYKREIAWPAALAAEYGLHEKRDLASVVAAYRPTVLIGTSGRKDAFDEATIRAMAAHTPHPVVFPFSNPTENAEATPADLLRWTDGRALVATGSPFAPVDVAGRRVRVGQGNNVFIFPGVGLGSLLAHARVVSDGMFSAAARALADTVTADELGQGLLFPAIPRLREISRIVAAAVMREASAEGVCDVIDDGEIERRIAAAVWEPEYPKFVREE
jgi:malate dehydrogenase (oxaloacetate-decarboxylating)